ncbi:hypothetical protein, partial [Mesorhizobium sp. M0809]|uniref:hypothetical protein n=1 Tax=Mesorhizobium sp. M0809 TaxID=2957003 RepID=UPI00333AEC28
MDLTLASAPFLMMAIAELTKKNPHSNRLWSAGSFLGDFRTPAGARNSYMGMVNYKRRHVDILMYLRAIRRSIRWVRLRDAVRERTQSTLYSVRAHA